MTLLNLLATSAFILAVVGMLRATLRSFEQAGKNSLPGFEPLVEKPKRVRTSSDPFYRG